MEARDGTGGAGVLDGMLRVVQARVHE